MVTTDLGGYIIGRDLFCSVCAGRAEIAAIGYPVNPWMPPPAAQALRLNDVKGAPAVLARHLTEEHSYEIEILDGYPAQAADFEVGRTVGKKVMIKWTSDGYARLTEWKRKANAERKKRGYR